ncbi:MAG: helix-turn-helix transcriptional regulator [Eubacterium sp.]|nr:helix-turn-helix transcriptional regulator [Eubacterium sp.]
MKKNQDNEFNQELFSKRLTELLFENSVTTRELADKLQMNHATIVRYANAVTKPKMPTVEKISEIFGVSELWLKGISDTKFDKKTRRITDKELMFALFGGDVTEEKLSEVKKFAQFIKDKN